MNFKLPPIIKNEKGEVRKAGFELEFAEVDSALSAQIITNLFGGDIHKENQYYYKITNTSLGDFTVQMDARLLTEKSYQKLFEAVGIDIETLTLGDKPMLPSLENMLERAASTIIPYEIVTPPIPITDLQKVEQLREALFQQNAQGTKSAIEYAFATHINPEIPAENMEVLLHYLQAFLVLYPWLLKALKVDFSRRVTAFINPFPEKYIRLVLQADYQPSLDDFIDDYCVHNADRNRALDLYPVFAWMRPEKIEKMTGIGKVSARPTFHFRMPNCLVDNPDWRVANEWNHWVEVENLANDPEQLRALCDAYLQMEKDTLLGFHRKWHEKIAHGALR